MRCFAVLALVLSGCGPDCAPGPNIQVRVLAGPGVDATRVASLRIVLSLDGMQPKSLDIPITQPLQMPKTVLLEPDPPPAPKYNVALSVQALDGNGGVFALGTAAGDMVSNGCNRLEASLFPLGGPTSSDGGDGFIPPDLLSTDMSNCVVASASVPDEDQDGRADSCDLCPDDYDPTPVDSDLDGLPDACDPDPARPSNTLLYFDPFNANSGNWTGNFMLRPFPQGYWAVDSAGPGTVTSGNTQVMLPANVRVQAHIYSPGVYGSGGGGVNASFGLFLGSNPNPGLTSTDGVLCIANASTQQPDNVAIYSVVNGNTMLQASTPIPGGWSTQVLYRLRLTQRGGTYVCELNNAQNTTSVTKMFPISPSAPQFMALYVQGMVANYHAVVAESALP